MVKLKNKTALVTDASEGIGREIALKLAKENVNLILLSRNETSLNKVKEKAIKLGSKKVRVYPCDLSLKQDVKDAVGSMLKSFKNIDILINNAGIWQKQGPLDSISIEEIESVINTNLTGLILLTNLLLPTLRKSKEGVIINVSSRSGYSPKIGQSVYQASKWGVRGFTEVLKLDMKDSNIRVAGLYQGGTRTKLFEKHKDPIAPEMFKKYTEPDDLADVILFMLTRPPKIWLHEVRVEY